MEYTGCVYAHPVQSSFTPIAADELCRADLANMTLVGKPIYASHNSNFEEIGHVTAEWHDEREGGKHIQFTIEDRPEFGLYHTGIKSGLWSELSLGHVYNARTQDLHGVEVSICHKGARRDCIINRNLSNEDYKQRTQSSSLTSNEGPLVRVNASATATAIATATMADSSKEETPQEQQQQQPPVSNDNTPEDAQKAPQNAVLPEEQLTNTIESMRRVDPDGAKLMTDILIEQEDKILQLNAANAEQAEKIKQAEEDLKKSENRTQALEMVTDNTVQRIVQAACNYIAELGDNFSGETHLDTKQVEETMSTLGREHPNYLHVIDGLMTVSASAGRQMAQREMHQSQRGDALRGYFERRNANMRHENRSGGLALKRSHEDAPFSAPYTTSDQKFDLTVNASNSAQKQRGSASGNGKSSGNGNGKGKARQGRQGATFFHEAFKRARRGTQF